MNLSDHQRCSETLAAYVRGDLSAGDRSWVRDHLGSCAECRAEEGALRRLRGGATPMLTEMERARLRRSVLATLPTEAGPARGEPSPARGGRGLQILGAAALLLIIGVFVYSSGLVGGGLGGLDEGDSGAGGGTADGPAQVQEEDSARLKASTGAADGAMSETASGPPAPEPTFRRAWGEITGRRLNKLGREGLPLVVFSSSYRAEQVPRLQARFRDQLALAAGPRAEVVRECSDLVTQQFPHSLPAYGALATLEKLRGRQVLVLAFAWTDEPSGPLDQSMVWAWPADNCNQPVEYYKNVIQPEQ